jgi:hypothetical protein
LTVGADLSSSRQGAGIDPDCATASTSSVSGTTAQSIGRDDSVKIYCLRNYTDQTSTIAANRTGFAAAATTGIVWISEVAIDPV